MGLKTYDFNCIACKHQFEEIVNCEPGEAWPEDKPIPCPACKESSALRLVAAPRVLRASYRDGAKRPGFAEMKKADDLEAQSYDLSPEDRGEYQQEVDALRKQASDTITKKGGSEA